MKTISIQDLKARLSMVIGQAEAGETIVITRHNAAVAHLGPAGSRHLYRGSRFGRGQLGPAVARGTGGRYLAVLTEDRGDR